MPLTGKAPFLLRVHDLHWLAGLSPERDLCAHGSVDVEIGDEILRDRDLCVSAAALYLLRTLTMEIGKCATAGPTSP